MAARLGHLYTLDTLPSSSSSAPSASASASASVSSSPSKPSSASPSRLSSFLSSLRTLANLISINPLAKLEASDLSGPTPSWTRDFIGGPGDYSWPAEASQARMRVQENVRHYARNYMFLSLLFFTCCLYQMPISLLGLLACLGIWEGVRLSIKSWEMEKYPVLQQVMVQFSLITMLIHASLRKLTPLNKSNGTCQPKKVQKKSVQLSLK